MNLIMALDSTALICTFIPYGAPLDGTDLVQNLAAAQST